MSRRNPLNDRYVMEKDKEGKSRKSAASAKPKARAGESNTGSVSTGPRSDKSKMSRKERKEAEAAEFETLGPRARERQLRIEYHKWDTWRRRMVIISFVLMFLALTYPITVSVPNDVTSTISMVLWALPFIAIGVGIYISYAKQRPIGRILGIKYGREEKAESRAAMKERSEKARRQMNRDEQKVAARVEEKERRTQEREERRKANKAAEEERQQKLKEAGQGLNKK